MDTVFEYTVPDFLTLTVSGNVGGRLQHYLNRIGKSIENDEAKVTYKFSDAQGELRLWNDSSNRLASSQQIVSKEITALPVFFETRYFLRADFGKSVTNVRVLHPLAVVADCFNFANGTLVGTLDFINTPGKFRLNLEIQTTTTTRTTTLEFMVVSVKMDVVHDYQTILETIEREQKNLVYAFMSKTLGDANYSSTDKTQQDAIWYAIFQKVFVFYTDACERVIHQPYLKYVGNVYHQKADRIKRWSPQLTNRFASMEKGRQPKEYFRTEQIDPEIDSVENRFILFTLHELGKRLTAFALKLSKLDSVSQDYVNRINDQSQALLEMSTHPFFKRVGRFKGFRQDSLVLQKRQGYAQIYASWLTLKNALDPTGTDVDIGYRPISALYEFWCFLAMRDHLVGHYGMPVETIGDISKLSDLLDDETEGNESESLCKMDVVFMDTTGKRRITLSYQKTYGTRTTEETFAHLNSQRPDIVLTIQESETTSDHTVFTYLFDAKYRISDFGGKDASPREAINDMHRYRDAILYRAQQRNGLAHEIIGAYVLFPGRPLPQSYDYQKTIQAENIGAIPLLPTTEGKQSLHSFLGNVLAKRGIKKHLATAIPPRGTSINLSNTSDVAIFLRDAPVKGVQECAIKEGVYPAPLTSTATPELIEWIPLSISNHPVRMLQVLEYLGQQSSHEILSAYPLFMTHNVQFGEKMFHLWKIKECDKE